MERKADRVYVNGKIYTVDAENTVVQAFCIKDDRFMAVGTEEEVLKYCDEKTERIDLNGQVVLPGLIDAHLHIQSTGIGKMELDLNGKTKEEILEIVADAYKNGEPGKWILGRGWVNSQWEDISFPSKEELDAVAPDSPVYLKRACGHAGWANTLGFKLAGVTEETPDPVGGEFMRKEDGTLLGVMTDQAQDYFIKTIPPYGDEDLKTITLLAAEEFIKNGLTTIHDCGEPTEILPLWDELYESGKLKLRIYCMVRAMGRPNFEELYKISTRDFKNGILIGAHDNRLTARCYKISGDGSLGARSAWMLEDYSDKPGHKGNGKWTDEQLYQVCYEAHRAGFQISYHGIGDAANRQALDIYERLLKEMPNPDHRHRIEHAQILAPNDVPRFKQLGVIPTHQTVFLRTDKQCADDRVGERIKWSYAWRTLIDEGNVVPNGTDSPVEHCNPFVSMYCAVSRKDEHGLPEEGWHKEEAMTREEALRSYTTWGAYAGFEENLKGSIEVGKLADFVIVSDDMMTCPEEKIKDIQVLETVIGGETVYKK